MLYQTTYLAVATASVFRYPDKICKTVWTSMVAT